MIVVKLIRNGFVILIFLIIGIYLTNRYLDPIPFESEKWKVQSDTELSLRWDMMNSLRKNYKLQGMSKNEVVNLLGEPSSKYKNRFEYDLGPSGRGINYGYLELTFNEKGRVKEYIVGDH